MSSRKIGHIGGTQTHKTHTAQWQRLSWQGIPRDGERQTDSQRERDREKERETEPSEYARCLCVWHVSIISFLRGFQFNLKTMYLSIIMLLVLVRAARHVICDTTVRGKSASRREQRIVAVIVDVVVVIVVGCVGSWTWEASVRFSSPTVRCAALCTQRSPGANLLVATSTTLLIHLFYMYTLVCVASIYTICT